MDKRRMPPLGTEHLTARDVARAAELLRAGANVAFPTETVYGLGGLASDDRAVAGIFAAKNRPSFNPLIAHVADLDMLHSIALVDAQAERLAQAFWPGPLTLVLPLRAGAALSPLVSAGLATVAVRMPAHPLARALLAAVAAPVAAPSANPSGKISPTTAAHVLDGLSGRIDAVLDGGPCGVGVESTILGLAPLQLLRAGGLPVEEIEALLGTVVAAPASPTTPSAPTAPGQLASHYAPDAAMRLDAKEAQEDELLLGFGAVAADVNLSPSADLLEAAANLFAAMHQLDDLAAQKGLRKIAVSPIPETGLGRAINDRLRRAAAPRD
ncbi:Threonylcarbamoyl-AMP synthase [Aquimixticola soesokkakensis]|uniref:Threonylcarbamoyl-AMP synthase n=1 Tax=Aquimixticola soesokkakensis TaxID=1519096 RepID=A0A1Y5RS08_9RHOB|nr:L-threonylcarbamoyladenylate synthase [Aquimixticola soesokkakensis]SLN21209.1 Threonylcarbamoyl-AMP synthase [Aquimixticola soesokkakensis]